MSGIRNFNSGKVEEGCFHKITKKKGRRKKAKIWENQDYGEIIRENKFRDREIWTLTM